MRYSVVLLYVYSMTNTLCLSCSCPFMTSCPSLSRWLSSILASFTCTPNYVHSINHLFS